MGKSDDTEIKLQFFRTFRNLESKTKHLHIKSLKIKLQFRFHDTKRAEENTIMYIEINGV